MASSSWDTSTQEDEFEIELDVLQGAPFGPAPHLDSLDGDLLDMTVDVQDVRRLSFA